MFFFYLIIFVCLKHLQMILTFLIHQGILDVFLSDYDIICLLEICTDDPDFSDTPFNDHSVRIMPISSKNKYGGYHGLCTLSKKVFFIKQNVLKIPSLNQYCG